MPPKKQSVVTEMTDGSCCCPLASYYTSGQAGFGVVTPPPVPIEITGGCCTFTSGTPPFNGFNAISARWNFSASGMFNFHQPNPDCDCHSFNGSWNILYDPNYQFEYNCDLLCVNGGVLQTCSPPGICLWDTRDSDSACVSTGTDFVCPKWTMFCTFGLLEADNIPRMYLYIHTPFVDIFSDTNIYWSRRLQYFNPLGNNRMLFRGLAHAADGAHPAETTVLPGNGNDACWDNVTALPDITITPY